MDVPLTDPKKREKISLKLFFAYVLLAAALLTITICALSAVVIRGIDDIIPSLAPALGLDGETAATLSAIFSQLDHAKLSVHHEVPAVLALIFSLFVGMILRTGKMVKSVPFILFVIAAVLMGILLALFSLGMSVWMTDVNDIRFGDVVISLSKMIEAGVLANL